MRICACHRHWCQFVHLCQMGNICNTKAWNSQLYILQAFRFCSLSSSIFANSLFLFFWSCNGQIGFDSCDNLPHRPNDFRCCWCHFSQRCMSSELLTKTMIPMLRTILVVKQWNKFQWLKQWPTFSSITVSVFSYIVSIPSSFSHVVFSDLNFYLNIHSKYCLVIVPTKLSRSFIILMDFPCCFATARQIILIALPYESVAVSYPVVQFSKRANNVVGKKEKT